ncbi:hypoxanthine phosphoribosyltransferase [Lignipirellula cremea]|uniref:Hypoxanthine phosphoribosyltransferase n=1 Tax=Lignipirellula cremea TaxID=2528010 RepID=A0A518E251_9BACT|nr:hypoxanthine phosphoribosyltransferase [Lignipirellula cremea]QDU98169.1 Hypoxanthine-guanine phosphoribosyltransferase [Lignipirellula cremea]
MKILLDENQVREGVSRLAREVTAQYGEAPLTLVGVMTGSLVLVADLIRQLSMPLRVGVVQASSYSQGTERGPLSIDTGMVIDLAGRDVLLVDDIFDTGHTLEKIVHALEQHGPNSVRSAVLLSKEGRAETSVRPDFSAFPIPDAFVVGYGLDYRDEYRNLPYIAVLEESDLGEGA